MLAVSNWIESSHICWHHPPCNCSNIWFYSLTIKWVVVPTLRCLCVLNWKQSTNGETCIRFQFNHKLKLFNHEIVFFSGFLKTVWCLISNSVVPWDWKTPNTKRTRRRFHSSFTIFIILLPWCIEFDPIQFGCGFYAFEMKGNHQRYEHIEEIFIIKL